MQIRRPQQFQRRKLLVVLIVSTPLLTLFPHSGRNSIMEERQPRLPFHRRRRPAVNYNTRDSFKELSQAIDEMEKQAVPSVSRAERLPKQTRGSTRGMSSITTPITNTTATEAHPHPDSSTTGIRYHFGTPQPSPLARKSRKRVVRDSDEEDEDLVMSKRKKTQDGNFVQKNSHLQTPPSSVGHSANLSTASSQLMIEPMSPPKKSHERVNSIGPRTFTIAVDPLTTEGDVEEQLKLLLRKYRASITLGMADMEQAILNELETSKVITFELFRSFRHMCFDEDNGHFAKAESSLGAWIERRRARYLFDLTGLAEKEEDK